jgi:hypothetical protein
LRKTPIFSQKIGKNCEHNIDPQVHIECFDPEIQNRSIGQLIKELDDMCQRLGKQDLFWMPSVPIFNQVGLRGTYTKRQIAVSRATLLEN